MNHEYWGRLVMPVNGVNDRSGTTWTFKNACVSMLDAISLALCTMSPPTETGDNAVLHDNSPLVKGTRAVMPRISHRETVLSQSGVHRCVPDRVGGTVWWGSSEKALDCGEMQAPHQLFVNVHNLFASETFQFQAIIFWSGQTVVSYINRQGGTRFLPLLNLSHSLLLWCNAQCHSHLAQNATTWKGRLHMFWDF